MLKGKTQPPTIILDGDLDSDAQPPTRHTLVSFLYSPSTLHCGCHSNYEANNSPNLSSLKSREPGRKIAPIKFALQSIGFHCCHHVTPFPVPPVSIVFPHPPTYSGEDSIINQFTSCERHPAEDGNVQWQMKDIGKHFLAGTVSWA